MFVVEQLDGKSSQEEFQKYKGFVNHNNKLLQLEFSLENLLTLREYRATHEEVYQADLNNSGLQKDLQKWKSKTTPIGKNVMEFREIKAMILGCGVFIGVIWETVDVKNKWMSVMICSDWTILQKI